MELVRSDGIWTWFNWPVATFSSTYNTTYYGFTGTDGYAWIGSYNHSSGATIEKRLNAEPEIDDHINTAVIVLASGGPHAGKIMAAFSHHNGASASYVSDTEGSVVSFEPGVQVSSSGASYVTLAQTDDTSKTVYMFYRHLVGSDMPHKFKISTNGGDSWGSETTLINTSGNNRPYVQIRKTGASRIDCVFTDGHPNETSNSVYHFYIEVASDGTREYFKSDGTSIGDDTSLPITATNATLVYDGSTTNSWVWDLASVGGAITALFTTFASSQAVHTYWRATLSEGLWTTEQITDGGPHSTDYLYATEPFYSGGICVDPSDSTSVYLSKCYGAADFRVEKWTKSGTWAKAADVSGSTASTNARPRWIEGISSPARIMYWSGSYASYTDFSTDLYVYPYFVAPASPTQSGNGSAGAGLFSSMNTSVVSKLKEDLLRDYENKKVDLPSLW